MKIDDISSVVGLAAHDGSINLSGCFHNRTGHATFVNVSKDDYNKCKSDSEQLKALFLATYEKSGSVKLY